MASPISLLAVLCLSPVTLFCVLTLRLRVILKMEVYMIAYLHTCRTTCPFISDKISNSGRIISMGQMRDDIVPNSMNVRQSIQLTSSVLQRQHSVDGRLLPCVETTEARAAPVPESLLSNSPCCSHVRPIGTVLPALSVFV